MPSPKISVVMSSYNHQDFVGDAIESVLVQQDVDFEFLIADDGSSDATQDVIRQYDDPRIRFSPNPSNRGACESVNGLIAQSTGAFVALINSDDVWSSPDKLAHQLAIFEENPELGACFGRARYIDRHGAALDKGSVPFGAIFDQPNRSQADWLRHFFLYGNCLCHPTLLIRKSCYHELSAYNNRLRQLPDFDMWTRLIKRYPIFISERELVDFRFLPGENASSPTFTNSVRTVNEHFVIVEKFLEDASQDLLKGAFQDMLPQANFDDPIHLDIARVLPFFHEQVNLKSAYSLIGHVKLKKLLDSAPHRAVLDDQYGIDDHWFHEQMGKEPCLSIRPEMIRSEETHRQIEATLRAQLAAFGAAGVDHSPKASVMGRFGKLFKKS